MAILGLKYISTVNDLIALISGIILSSKLNDIKLELVK